MKSLRRMIAETLGYDDFVPSPPPVGVIPQPTSYPFRTDSAREVWKCCIVVMGEFPHLDNKQTLKLGHERSGISALELTPEDWRLLEMAIEAERSAQRWMRPATGDLGDELPKL